MRIDRGQVEQLAGRIREMTREAIRARETNVSAAAREMSINRVTLSRVLNGAQPDLHTAAALAAWSGFRLDLVYAGPREELTQDSVTVVQ